MIEEFRYYKGTKAVYEVSNLGRVKRNGVLFECKPMISGYLAFCGNLVHRAVAQLFIPNPENKPYVDHIDTNKLNNTVDNLRWVTPSENMLNPITRKRNSEGQTWQRGAGNPNYGKHWDEAHRKHMSEVMTGKHLVMPDRGPQWRANISKGRTGLKLSEEVKALRREKMRLKKLAQAR